MPSDAIRAFIAVSPDAEARRRAAEVLRQVRARCGGKGWRVNWVPPENLHITLQFLGWVDPARVDPIVQALASLSAHASFRMRFEGVGSFPPVGHPRVIWIGVREGANDLEQIASEVQARTETLGFSPEERRFHPHLTLGRVKRAAGRAEDVLHPLRDVEGGTCQVSEVVLYQSQLRPDGPVYTPLATIPLASPSVGR